MKLLVLKSFFDRDGIGHNLNSYFESDDLEYLAELQRKGILASDPPVVVNQPQAAESVAAKANTTRGKPAKRGDGQWPS